MNMPASGKTPAQYEVTVFPQGSLNCFRYVVIFSRFRNQWLYCRHKERTVWETAGGHIETGETPLEAAKRELREETGALDFEITPVLEYTVRVRSADGTFQEESGGKVFFAVIRELGTLPADFEMAETRLHDSFPAELRFPQILPVLYEKLQNWLNLQSAKDEIWDVYDKNRTLTGRTHRRGDPLKKGDYHLVVHVWLQNTNGVFLITQRSPQKGYPGMWECTGGSAVTGDGSLQAAIREVREETGLDAQSENASLLFTLKGEDNFCDIWLIRQDFDINRVRLQENETCGVRYATKEEIRKLHRFGKFVPTGYLDDLFAMI